MKFTLRRLLFLVSLLVIGLIGGGMAKQQGNPSAVVSIEILFAMIIPVFVIYFIILDYRERERRREQDTEERIREEIEKWK